MKTARSIFTACVAALACASAVAAADNPPAINLAALQAYTRGTASIAGTTSFSKEGTAYCAPDVPYVNWYVGQLNSPRHPAYLLGRYTRTSPVGKDGTFTCKNLARGRYVVWIEGDRRVGGEFSGQPTSSETNPNGQMVGPGETSSDKPDRNLSKNAFGSDSASTMARFFAGPQHVVVGRGTVSVRI
jgi:opacity protein-like surface antigen